MKIGCQCGETIYDQVHQLQELVPGTSDGPRELFRSRPSAGQPTEGP